jgi:hypothetical protein
MVGGVATLAACIPLALRYRREQLPLAHPAVSAEVPDAEPGDVVDFAPRLILGSGSGDDVVQARRADTA